MRGLLGKHSQGFLHFKIVGLENQLVMSISNLGFCETCVCVRACREHCIKCQLQLFITLSIPFSVLWLSTPQTLSTNAASAAVRSVLQSALTFLLLMLFRVGRGDGKAGEREASQLGAPSRQGVHMRLEKAALLSCAPMIHDAPSCCS